MTHACEAVKTRHKETSLIFPVLALVVLFLWGSSQSLPVVIGINILALIGILSSAFSVVRHADVLAHRLGEPYGSLILSLSVVILEVSLISALMATGDAAPTLMRDTLYSIIMIVTGGLVGFSLLLGGCSGTLKTRKRDNKNTKKQSFVFYVSNRQYLAVF